MMHKYQPNQGWFACNIADIGAYISQMRKQVRRLTARRLQQAIQEDSYGTISLDECKRLLKQYP